MPIGKIHHKPNHETLKSISMDSTLDSRMSSAEIPQMELLKINYVHQCKEALMHKVDSSRHLPTQRQRPQSINFPHLPNKTIQSYDNSVIAHRKSNAAANINKSQGNITKITINTTTTPTTTTPTTSILKNGNTTSNKQVLHTPPTIESWQFIQHTKPNTSNAVTAKFIAQHLTPADYSDSSCCTNASDNDHSNEPTTSPACEKSNSWDYRAKISTRDIRRDLARAGIKSRADRIARIEQKDCEQRDQVAVTPINVTSTENVNKQTTKQNITQQQRTPLKQLSPPQPKRQAPAPTTTTAAVPKKEPNMRHRNYVAVTAACTEQRNSACNGMSTSVNVKNLDSNTSATSGAAMQNTKRADCAPNVRFRATQNDNKHQISRIPKPVNNQGNRLSAPPTLASNEPIDSIHRNVEEIFAHEANLKQLHYADLKTKLKYQPTNEAQLEFKSAANKSAANAAELNMLLRNSWQPAVRNFQKVKVERIHIRKKPQLLQIINQLSVNDPQIPERCSNADPSVQHAAAEKTERRTCGYKNCNIINCPMSAHQHNCNEENNKLKRLSLESCSDSGVSSSNDCKEQLKNECFKNTTDCTSCVKLQQHQQQKHSTKIAHNDYHAHNKHKSLTPQSSYSADSHKLKEMDCIAGTQIKIHIGKAQIADPNDLQNFSKKNVTKATTDELLTAAANSSNTKRSNKTKQCNIENELKYNEQRSKYQNLRQCTTIKIDDDWVQEQDAEVVNAADNALAEYNESDELLMPAARRKSINTNDNCVKLFVRSSSTNSSSLSANRASTLSTLSFASQVSGVSCRSTASSSTCSSQYSNQSCGSCNISMQPDNKSFCTAEANCCCCEQAPCLPFNDVTVGRRNSMAPRASSEISCISCTNHSNNMKTAALADKKYKLLECNAVGGVFWNNSYFCQDTEVLLNNSNEGDDQCCCSLSSCDDDNCSYYEVPLGSLGNYCSDGNINCLGLDSAGDINEWHKFKQHQHMQQQLLRITSAENILMRNNKMLKKTDVIHELRPRSMDGVVDSGVSLNGDTTGSSPDNSEHMQNQQDTEARRLKRGHVLTELLETERIYVSEMSSILKGYCDQMQSKEMMHLVPTTLQGKEDILFGNLHELYTFHNEVFLQDLENCISTTELVALCFVQRRDTFYRLYSFYCQNIPRSERLRETLVDTHLFLQECQKRLGHKLPLAAYLLKPVQRITKYQLLLKDLLRFSDSGSCTKELQKALDCMLIVLKCVNDSMHQVAITGFPNDLTLQGELLLQDSFQVWTESKKDIRLRIKPQQRHIFLYQKSMLFCKQTSKPGHNKSTYQFKHYLKMSQIGLTESVRGDTKRFEVWLQGRQEVHTLQAPTIEIKNKWVTEIKRVLLNQLEELKGEKIKQYGLNHRGLKQTTSWDTPNIILGTPQRTISCDASSESSNRNSNCSSDDNCPISGVTSSNLSNNSTEKEQQEACGWSSDYSNSEDEMSIIEDNSTPGSKFIALADYVAVGHSEVSMREGEIIELLKVGCAGWWFVRVIDSNTEGWTPAAYLESINRRSSQSSSRNQERINP